ncbi:glycoside hydrolase family 18 protein [Aquimarina celericrescens]|uniref:chitinase n=1 Tax=Aquimarina celericrescens TaxID=1964542 RepID=A0ABW5ARK8_9FLAO
MRRFYYTFPLILLMALMFTLSSHAQKKVGYIQSWRAQVTADQASKLTHVIYSFATIHPDLDGKLNAIDGSYLSTMVSIAHAQGAKAILAVGGWFPCSYAYQSGACAADGNPEAFNAVSQGSARTNFVNNLYNLIVQYDLDGIDLDWEYPSAGSQGLYVNLLAALKAKMNTHPTKNLELSTAVPASAYRGQHFSSSAFQYLDDIHIMAYDASPRINHSTYAFAASAINYWQGRGVSSSRLQLGLPFYGWNASGGSMAY